MSIDIKTLVKGQSVILNGGNLATINSIKGRWVNITEDGSDKPRNIGTKDISATASVNVEGPAGRKNGIVPARYLDGYAKVKLGDGIVTRDNGDDVAILLRGKELYDVIEVVAHKLGVTHKELRGRFGHLNPGQQRMCLGNMLRKALRDADKE